MQKLLSLIRSHLFIFVFNFNSITLGGGSQRILLWFLSESVFPMFFSRSFIVSGLTFRSLIHFEFICMYGVRKCSSFILLHVPHPLLSLILNTSASVNMSECYSDHISPMSLQLWNGFLLRIKYQSFQGSVGLCTTWPPTYLTPLLLSPPIPSDWDTPELISARHTPPQGPAIAPTPLKRSPHLLGLWFKCQLLSCDLLTLPKHSYPYTLLTILSV